MSVLILAQLRFKDRARYDRYQAKFAEVFGTFRGRLVAADEHPRLLEGEDAPDKVVLLEFPDEAAAREFHNSSAYQEISIDRQAGADALVLQFRGFSLRGVAKPGRQLEPKSAIGRWEPKVPQRGSMKKVSSSRSLPIEIAVSLLGVAALGLALAGGQGTDNAQSDSGVTTETAAAVAGAKVTPTEPKLQVEPK